MNSQTFNEHFEMLQVLEKTILMAKAEEYAHGDRLSNFHDAGDFNKCVPTTALWGMVTKHIIALRDFIIDYETAEGHDQIPPEQWFEKLRDIRTYMYLLSAILYDLNPFYKEFFDDRTKHLHEVSTTPATKSSNKRGGKVL